MQYKHAISSSWFSWEIAEIIRKIKAGEQVGYKEIPYIQSPFGARLSNGAAGLLAISS
jgi:hypothetical protein